MNINLINPFMTGVTKTPYKLKQTCIFQLLDWASKYNLLLPSDMKVFKGKTIHKINGLIGNTVKPVYNNHLGDEVSVVIIDRWLL